MSMHMSMRNAAAHAYEQACTHACARVHMHVCAHVYAEVYVCLYADRAKLDSLFHDTQPNVDGLPEPPPMPAADEDPIEQDFDDFWLEPDPDREYRTPSTSLSSNP